LKKQANRPITNTNSSNSSGSNANLTASSEDRPRTVRKP